MKKSILFVALAVLGACGDPAGTITPEEAKQLVQTAWSTAYYSGARNQMQNGGVFGYAAWDAQREQDSLDYQSVIQKIGYK